MLNIEMLYLLVGLATTQIDDDAHEALDALMVAPAEHEVSVTPDDDVYVDIGI